MAWPAAIRHQGRALLRCLGLDYTAVEFRYIYTFYNEESAIMNGLYRWVRGKRDRPPTWAALLEAMSAVGIEAKFIMDLKEELLEGTVCNVKWLTGSLMI